MTFHYIYTLSLASPNVAIIIAININSHKERLKRMLILSFNYILVG